MKHLGRLGIVAIPLAIGVICVGGFTSAPTVTFSSPGARASELLAELGPKLGADIGASPDLADEFLVVRFAETPKADVLAKIAAATHATWVQHGSQTVLERTTQNRNQLKALELDARVAIIKAGQASKRAELKKQGEFGQSAGVALAQELASVNAPSDRPMFGRGGFQKMRELGTKTPVGRAVARLAIGMSAEELARMEPDIETVWSTNPTSLQRPLGSLGADVLQSLLQEQDVWAAASAAQPAPAQPGRTMRMMGSRMASMYSGSLRQQPVKILFSASQGSPRGGVRVSLQVVDGTGTTITQASASLYPENVDEGREGAAPAAPNDPRIHYPESAAAYAKCFTTRGSGPTMPPEIKEAFLHPDQHEPLSMVAGPLLLAVAEAKNVSAVVDVPDSSMVLLSLTGPTDDYGADQLLKMCSDVMTIKQQGGWLLGWSAFPVFDQDTRADRKALAKFIQLKAAGQDETIEQRCEFAVALPDMNTNYLPALLEQPFAEPIRDLLDQDGLMKFYGSLTKRERSQAASDGLALSDLSRKSQAYLNRLIFGPGRKLTPVVPKPITQADHGFVIVSSASGLEPTEELADGIPNDAYLKIDEQSESGAIYSRNADSASMMPPQFMTVDELVQNIEHPGHASSTVNNVHTEWTQDGTGLRSAQRRSLTFTFHLNPKVNLANLKLETVQYSKSNIPDYNGLPPEIQKAVQQKLDADKAGGQWAPPK